jgi:hypothetical protein
LLRSRPSAARPIALDKGQPERGANNPIIARRARFGAIGKMTSPHHQLPTTEAAMVAPIASKKPVLWRGIRQIGLMWSKRLDPSIANPVNEPADPGQDAEAEKHEH